jgi:signal transduction histidine kinase
MTETPHGIPVLLVEDDQLQARVLRTLINHSTGGHFSLTRSRSIAQALECLGSASFSAVLLDLNLPDSTGLKTLSQITESHPELAVIVLTGTDSDTLALESLKLGAEDYIVKGQLSGNQICRALSHAIERKKNQLEMKKLQNMLQQERRLEALGAIASGIAHEINTPLQFIGTNLEFIKEVFDLLEKCVEPINEVPRTGRTSRKSIRTMRNMATSMTTDRMLALRREVPCSLSEAVEGVRRVKKIINAMNIFARTAGPTKTAYDVNNAVRDALTITRHEWKHIATTELFLEENLPPVPCYPEELSHCLLNLIVNAVHAIADAKELRNSNGDKGVITISTRRHEDAVEIRVGDSGTGIPENIQHRVFEPFFTTKKVGRGSGQGLSTVYQMIAQHMGGTVSFDSYADKGTVFKITLPLTSNDDDIEATDNQGKTEWAQRSR